MNLDQYALARRLAEAHPAECSARGIVLERHAPGKRPLRRRVVDVRDALEDLEDGFAPDLADPSCVGPLLELAEKLVPGVDLLDYGDQWYADGPSPGGPRGLGSTPGEALARMILEATP